MENDGLSKLIKQNHKDACVHINIKCREKVSEIKYNIIYVSYRIYKLMDLYISHDKSKRLNIYLFGLFFYTSIRIKERVVNLMIKFGKES